MNNGVSFFNLFALSLGIGREELVDIELQLRELDIRQEEGGIEKDISQKTTGQRFWLTGISVVTLKRRCSIDIYLDGLLKGR